MSTTALTNAREEFDVFKHRRYLNWAALSPPPRRAASAIREMVEQACSFRNGDINSAWHDLSAGVRREAGTLLNAAADDIAIAGSSTTQGVQLAFDSIRPSKGDNVVTDDLEFPSTGAELQRWKEKGVEVRIAKSERGEYSADDMISLMDDRTKAVVLSSVVWVNGFRPDLKTISAGARERGAFVVADAVQHMGAMKFDVGELRPDFAAAGGQKWMTSPFGAALLYVSRRAVEELSPPYISLNNTQEPAEGWAAYFARDDKTAFDTLEPVNNAIKMEYGGWLNHAGMVCLKESISLINSVGSENAQRSIRKLSGYLVECLDRFGAEIISPRDEGSASSITTFRVAKGQDEHSRIVQKLSAAGVDVSCRGSAGLGGIRVSVHHMNNEEDIDTLISSLHAATG